MNYRNRLEQLKGQQQKLETILQKKQQEKQDTQQEHKTIQKAQEILQHIAKETQETIVFHIENTVNHIIQAIDFTDKYTFHLDFVLRRNKTEADMYLEKGENRIDVLEYAGGGLADIVSFALRIALWNITKSCNTIVLDEPFKYLSRELRPQAGRILQELSEKMQIQFVIVTHDHEFINIADKKIKVKIQNGVSQVEEIC